MVILEDLIKQVGEKIKSMTPQQWRDAEIKNDIIVSNYLANRGDIVIIQSRAGHYYRV